MNVTKCFIATLFWALVWGLMSTYDAVVENTVMESNCTQHDRTQVQNRVVLLKGCRRGMTHVQNGRESVQALAFMAQKDAEVQWAYPYGQDAGVVFLEDGAHFSTRYLRDRPLPWRPVGDGFVSDPDEVSMMGHLITRDRLVQQVMWHSRFGLLGVSLDWRDLQGLVQAYDDSVQEWVRERRALLYGSTVVLSCHMYMITRRYRFFNELQHVKTMLWALWWLMDPDVLALSRLCGWIVGICLMCVRPFSKSQSVLIMFETSMWTLSCIEMVWNDHYIAMDVICFMSVPTLTSVDIFTLNERLSAEQHTPVVVLPSEEAPQDFTCSICLEGGDEVTTCLPCRHRFHRDCMISWATKAHAIGASPTCPLCRARLVGSGSENV